MTWLPDSTLAHLKRVADWPELSDGKYRLVEELAILEAFLIDTSQVVVDIYSRFLFESALFKRRAKSELSADDLCELMIRCQKETYGDGLDQRYLNPYMWAWKPHYYIIWS